MRSLYFTQMHGICQQETTDILQWAQCHRSEARTSKRFPEPIYCVAPAKTGCLEASKALSTAPRRQITNAASPIITINMSRFYCIMVCEAMQRKSTYYNKAAHPFQFGFIFFWCAVHIHPKALTRCCTNIETKHEKPKGLIFGRFQLSEVPRFRNTALKPKRRQLH